MGKKFDLLTGTRVLEEVESPVNGKVRVVQSIAWGNHVQVGKLTQSGGVVFDVWQATLRKVRKMKPEIQDCLILGLGGGSAARLVRRYWKEAEIIGVEIDPIMIDLGMRYLGLSRLGVDIKVEDAREFAKNQVKDNKKYDLVLVDVYVGDKVPEDFEKDEFIELAKKLVNDDGLIVFNRLFYGEKKGEAFLFRKKLEKYFPNITPVYPEANVMFVCQK
ncbi:fused MFS/spermidine synthase [Patescibacteria group bacterium]|nr:fused MFS/spermidine synthase [Patescibacteria group bacterium]